MSEIIKKQMTSEDKSGEFGYPKKIRITPNTLNSILIQSNPLLYAIDFEYGEYTPQEMEDSFGFSFCDYKIEICESVEGDYEIICRDGIEVWTLDEANKANKIEK